MITVETRKSIKCNGDYSIFVSFPYDYEVIETIKSFPQRYYEPMTREWELPAYKLAELRQKLPRFRFDIIDNKSILEKKETPVPPNFAFKTKPYKHQLECFEYGLRYDKFLLADEMGLGKTKESIDIAVAKKLQNNYTRCLIICCVNSVKWNWVNEIHTHSDESVWVLGQRKRKNKWVVAGNKDKLEDLQNLDDIESYFLVTNIETLRDKAIQEHLTKLLKSNKIQMIIADECHKCFDKNTEIETEIGKLKIGDIVKNRLQIPIYSYNEEKNIVELKPILNWFENNVNKKLIELSIQLDSGEVKTLRCTDDHKIYTKNRGWVCAKNLTSNDNLFVF